MTQNLDLLLSPWWTLCYLLPKFINHQQLWLHTDMYISISSPPINSIYSLISTTNPIFLLLPLVTAMYVYTLLSLYFPPFKFLLLSEAIFRMPGVCPRCDKNVYFAEEVFLCLNVLIWFHICILGEGVGQVLPQDVLQVYWLRVDSPSIHPVNLKIWVKRWKYFSAIIGWR